MLRQKALSASIWSAAEAILQRGARLVVTLVLARLITPAEFGTIALLSIFTGVAGTFVDSGFAAALTQRKDTTRLEESTVFWFNVGAGCLVGTVLVLLAPLIARFFSKPILIPLTWIMALSMVVGTFGTTHATLLGKRLDFRSQMKVTATATVASGALGIWLAWRGYGVWALAIQALASSALTSLVLWTVSGWRPLLAFSPAAARRLFGFGSYVLASSLVGTLYSRVYTILVGKFFGVADLGYYDRSEAMVQMPSGTVTSILNRVAFPIFCATGSDVATLRRGLQLSVRALIIINASVMFGLAAVARPAIFVLLGKTWLPAAQIMQVLCFAAVLAPLHIINLSALVAQGYSRLFFFVELIKKVIGLAVLVGGSFFGVMGVAYATALYSIVEFIINSYYTRKFLDYGFWAQVRDSSPTLLLAGTMFLLVYWLSLTLTMPPIALLPALIVIGAIYMFAGAWALKLRALQDLLHLLHRAPAHAG